MDAIKGATWRERMLEVMARDQHRYKCRATTLGGHPCSAAVRTGDMYCKTHRAQH